MAHCSLKDDLIPQLLKNYEENGRILGDSATSPARNAVGYSKDIHSLILIGPRGKYPKERYN